jgi:hypothetical protein
MQTLSFADDGFLAATYDGANCYSKDPDATQWENLFHQDRMPLGSPQEKWGQGLTGGGAAFGGFNAPWCVAAPSNSDYLYVVARTRGTGDVGTTSAEIWRRTTSAAGWRWENTGKYACISTAARRGMGPTAAVDPDNHLHVIFSDDAGAIWRTTDGFATITCLNAPGGPLAGVLPSAVTTAGTAPGGDTLTFGSGTIPTEASAPPAGYTVWMSDVSDNAAMQLSMDANAFTATTARSTTRDINGTVEAGDTIVFGMRAGIAFDRSSAVVGGITQGVYISWAYGADAVYRTTDGCATFAAMVGSPADSVHITCSHDGVLYVLPYGGSTYPANTPRRYMGGSWTNLSHLTSADNNQWSGVAADPSSAGRVAFIQLQGSVRCSADYGDTVGTYVALDYDANMNVIGRPRTDTVCPHLGNFVIPNGVSLTGTIANSMTHGQCAFDPTDPGKLWVSEGIGIWTAYPETSGTGLVTEFTGFNKNAQSIILNHMMKAPGGMLLASSQDRAGYRFPDQRTEPTGDFGFFASPLSGVAHGWGVDYAKNNKNFLILAITGGMYVSEDEGLLWALVDNTLGSQCAIACQTELNFVVFPNGSGNPQYTIDGGETFNNCVFDGGTDALVGWGGFFYNRKSVCADLVNPLVYYAYNYADPTTNVYGGTWRSTDSGATWTKMSGILTRPDNPAIKQNSGSVDFMLTAVQGKEGHLIMGTGTTANNGFPMMWSGNGGATWHQVGGTGVTQLACAGAAYPGKSYPALYQVGFNTTDADPTDPGVFVATDFDPLDPTAVIEWERICRAPAGNMDGPKHIVADPDVHGRWYMSSGGTGYTFGRLNSSLVRVNATA